MHDLNNILESLKEALDTMREVKHTLHQSLRQLEATGVDTTVFAEVAVKIAILTDREHEYLRRDPTLQDCVEILEEIIEDAEEDAETEDADAEDED